MQNRPGRYEQIAEVAEVEAEAKEQDVRHPKIGEGWRGKVLEVGRAFFK